MQKSLARNATLFLLFMGILLALHATVIGVPYFWDELGQFVPAALDIFNKGAWVPESTLPNVHPPGVMAYLAAVWTLFGYSVAGTRIAMLAVAAAGVLATLALTNHLCRNLPGDASFYSVALLLLAPLFWAQSMMVQLDMPAMVLTLIALLLFLKDRHVACAVACTALVLVKETSLVIPAVFGAVLLWERRSSHAFLYVAPALGLGGWIAVLYRATGHPLGNAEFTHYNVAFQLHPVRLPVTLVRRAFYLFIDNFHWIGAIAIVLAWRRTRIFRSRDWAVVGVAALAQTAVVSLFGGAALERYMLPVLPLFYIAVCAAWAVMAPRIRIMSAAAMATGLTAGIFFNSPFPFPFENNASFVTFVRLQRRAAEFISSEYPQSTVASAWPFPDALRRPEFGYIPRPVRVVGLDNFNPETVAACKNKADVLVIYSRTWEPRWSVLRMQWVRDFLTEYYFYRPQITQDEIERELGLHRVARWQRGAQWIEIYARSIAPTMLIL